MEEIKEKLKEINEKKGNELAKQKMYENNLNDCKKQYHEVIEKLSKIKKSQNINLLIIFITYILSAFTNDLITMELSNLFEGLKYSLLSILKVIVFIIPIISHISYFNKTREERELLKDYTEQKYKINHDIFDYTNLLTFCNKKIELYDNSIKDLKNLLLNNDKKDNNDIEYEIKDNKDKTNIKKVK